MVPVQKQLKLQGSWKPLYESIKPPFEGLTFSCIVLFHLSGHFEINITLKSPFNPTIASSVSQHENSLTQMPMKEAHSVVFYRLSLGIMTSVTAQLNIRQLTALGW